MAMLSDAERAQALKALPDWTFDADRGGIARSFRFADFGAAFSFMTGVALEAEKADHHPDWSNVWNRVDILLSTHSEGGVTQKDVVLAGTIDRLAGRLAEPAAGD